MEKSKRKSLVEGVEGKTQWHSPCYDRPMTETGQMHHLMEKMKAAVPLAPTEHGRFESHVGTSWAFLLTLKQSIGSDRREWGKPIHRLQTWSGTGVCYWAFQRGWKRCKVHPEGQVERAATAKHPGKWIANYPEPQHKDVFEWSHPRLN